MHVTQLLQAFLLTKDDEIVKTTLPHVPFGYGALHPLWCQGNGWASARWAWRSAGYFLGHSLLNNNGPSERIAINC
jgi:hypothetical protein